MMENIDSFKSLLRHKISDMSTTYHLQLLLQELDIEKPPTKTFHDCFSSLASNLTDTLRTIQFCVQYFT